MPSSSSGTTNQELALHEHHHVVVGHLLQYVTVTCDEGQWRGHANLIAGYEKHLSVDILSFYHDLLDLPAFPIHSELKFDFNLLSRIHDVNPAKTDPDAPLLVWDESAYLRDAWTRDYYWKMEKDVLPTLRHLHRGRFTAPQILHSLADCLAVTEQRLTVSGRTAEAKQAVIFANHTLDWEREVIIAEEEYHEAYNNMLAIRPKVRRHRAQILATPEIGDCLMDRPAAGGAHKAGG